MDMNFDSGIDVEVIFKFSPGTDITGWKRAKTRATLEILKQMRKLGVKAGYHRSQIIGDGPTIGDGSEHVSRLLIPQHS